jgi:hypothetical protein
MEFIYTTGFFSWIVQLLSGIFDLYVLFFIPVTGVFKLLKQLLWMEMIVQLIEFSFYTWMILQFKKIKNIVPFRYHDWIFSTPIMLLTFCCYLYILKNNVRVSTSNLNVYEILQENAFVFIIIFLLNFAMLLIGYLGEIGIIPMFEASIIGFIPFFLFFYMIYEYFAKNSSSTGIYLFYVFMFIWGLYGIASFQKYENKNIFYNILDLFSKNFFNVVLALCIYYKTIPYIGGL